MIDLIKEEEWLQEWVNDDVDNLGKDLDTRTFNALEVEMIMAVYSPEIYFSEKQKWYKKLWKKLTKIEQGEMKFQDYIKEVENKIIDKT